MKFEAICEIVDERSHKCRPAVLDLTQSVGAVVEVGGDRDLYRRKKEACDKVDLD